ncbi:hypothetical protein [Leptospira ilyithenensis]|uniref:DUF5683 domain-containing protein n=1 Tax=Leptospira ilyithenensis TaxID=2484901 RepID=A0A4R9LTD1_9LEPT|nr:hypothetical protein [Leptospira ilyithenensis]TGN13365.1 hypothetical protein EHS11_03805 [Leptospira ilyithenensis]
MKNNLSKYLYPVLFFSLHVGLLGETNHTIQWKPIENASGYSIEVKDTQGKVLTKETTEPSASFLLGIGTYTYRIGVFNKFKKIAKFSSWKELIVRQVSSPIIRSQSTLAKREGGKDILTVSGDNFYEGTKAYIIQDGKKIPVELETTSDHKTSIVKVESSKLNKNKDYKLVLENPKSTPVEIPIQSSSIVNSEEDTSTDETSSNQDTTNTKDKTSKSDYTPPTIWSLFWRQALIPGWGHLYAKDTKTGSAYLFAFLGTSLVALDQQDLYQSSRDHFRIRSNTVTAFRLMDPDAIYIPYYAGTLVNTHNAEDVRERQFALQTSLTIVGTVYLVSLAHILITGYQRKDPEQHKPGMSMGVKADDPGYITRSLDPQYLKMDILYSIFF